MFKKYFLLLPCLLMINTSINAQCDPNNTVESWYDWAKDWENYIVDYVPISTAQETRIGDSLHLQMAREYNLLEQHPKKASTTAMLQKIAQYTHRKDLRYNLHIIDDNKIANAFSIAGGHVYVTAKLLSWVESDDELAFVLAHEIAHVDSKHGIRKVAKLIAGETLGGSYGSILAHVENAVTAPFGQIDEYEADREGAVLAFRAGYNPRAGLDFFKRMGANEQYDDFQKLIRTHPFSSERYNCLDDFLRQQQQPQK